MEKGIGAVYEHGLLRPDTPLTDLVDGQRVWLVVRDLTDDPAEIKRRTEELIREMRADGRIVRPPPAPEPAPVDFKPIVIEGEPLSEQIIRERI
jgi:predicted DNA-binding antitoxin AbrB/MazE fold protein